jgi:hypothetical protein
MEMMMLLRPWISGYRMVSPDLSTGHDPDGRRILYLKIGNVAV